MKSPALHFDGEPDRFQRMKSLWNAPVPVQRVTWTDRILGGLMVFAIVSVLVALFAGVWICSKVGWIEER